MKIEKMVDQCFGYIVEIEKVEKTPETKKNFYFLRVTDRATEEIVEEDTCFTNRQELWQYYKDNYREEEEA